MPIKYVSTMNTCFKFGKTCHKKGIERICDEKLYTGSVGEQIHGF